MAVASTRCPGFFRSASMLTFNPPHMKTIHIKHIIQLTVVALTGYVPMACNDRLDLEPLSQLSPESYLWREEQLAAYVYRYYAAYTVSNTEDVATGGQVPSHMGNAGESFYHADDATDNVTTRTANDRYASGRWTVPQNGGFWNFTNIRALNYFIETVVPRYEGGKLTGGETAIKHHIGSAYFLRAQEYFFRLRKLGDFPIVTAVLPDDQSVLDFASQRNPRNEVARFILADLDNAIALLNNQPAGGKADITRQAALLLKARVALFEGTWLKYHSGTARVPNGPGWPGGAKAYNNGYSYPGGSIEAESNFFLGQAMEASAQVADALDLVPNNQVIRESAGQPVNPYYDLFASADPRAYEEVIMMRTYNVGLNIFHTYNHMLYEGAGRGYTRQFADAFLMQNGLPIYAPGSGYQGDDFIEDTKIDRDWRWRLFMKAPGEVKAFINIAAPQRFPDAPNVASADARYSTSTGYLLGKGFSHNFDMQVLNRDVTAAVVFRAAEAYLIYLEASYERNGTVDARADGYWRALRRRAGVDEDYHKTIDATNMAIEGQNDWGAYSAGAPINAMLYNIRRERRCELIGEGLRYDDLLRWRAMDQLNGFQIEGAKIWGPLKDRYAAGVLRADQANERDNTVSSPTLSGYLRPFQIVQTNNVFYNGFDFNPAHYLYPIAAQHFLISAPDRSSPETSPIYQNPGWLLAAGGSAQ